MKRIGSFLIFILLFVLMLPTAIVHPLAEEKPVNVMDQALQAHLNALAPNQTVSVIVYLRDQTNVGEIIGKNRSERRRNLLVAMKNKSDSSQVSLRALLRRRMGTGDVKSFLPLWVVNAILLNGNQSIIDELTVRPEVNSIVLDQIIPGPETIAETLTAGSPEQNINVVNAPALWSMGYLGQGVVVANMDTGVDYNHPDLRTQWRGGTNSWYDPYGQHPLVPTDLKGHGTWTMGVMVGRDAGGTSIGMAPQASWIAVKIFNDNNVATTSGIHLGFQWLLDPDGNPQTDDAPDVVNNSWTLNTPGCDLSYEPDLQALVAAGILPVFAAGNYGPYSSTSPSPANNPDAFAVGSINNSSVIYSYSSRGPTSCGRSSSSTYPDLVAPGVNIRSSDLYGSYYYSSGTSLSAPHVSGALALLLSAFPNLSVADQRAAIKSAAVDLGLAGPDNTFGNGRLDVLGAYNLISGGMVPTATLTVSSTTTATPVLTLTSSATPAIPTTSIPSSSPTVTATFAPSPTGTFTPSSTPASTFTQTPTPILTSTPTTMPSQTFTASPNPITASPTPTVPASTATPSRTPTAFPNTATSSPVTSLHVGDLDRSSSLFGTRWTAIVTILVHDNLEHVVPGATVTGRWSNGAFGTVTCTTNASGVCTVTKTGLSTNTPSVTFTVTSVAKSSLAYSSASNHDPDGDSTGTVITIIRP